ncbi:MAG: hypothetical protein ACD_50C00301G0007 [uncultured bacterium]|nr:MAG: hypothetical protein ACD_50C00301G0007 [uncultured bacterium]KKR60760.1 MAG: hypothetical protein UT99_C0008G0029 [Candidatus Curtissbacteria bacterium GW2011_GWA2_40_31]KKR61649.1 MAG: hypothetical protein UU00_C0010G0037 [Microgenomates group bacterium GW2011_GWC1_40_35]KKR77839.1 MAG: hypothetical protein UU19_C0002G0029 [Candidatus Curtissbacteria bacterium GW2011_GWD1_40_8]KKS01831.1 MAG: hypothetical protein UU53_C0007G0041 [Candidatus Curtissbacteria bacterium GW2011_GWC2_41_21]
MIKAIPEKPKADGPLKPKAFVKIKTIKVMKNANISIISQVLRRFDDI